MRAHNMLPVLGSWLALLVLLDSACSARSIPAPARTSLPPTPSQSPGIHGSQSPEPTPQQPPTFPAPTRTALSTLPPTTDFWRGVTFWLQGPGDAMRKQSEWVLANLVKPTGASWVSLAFMCYQQTELSTSIPCDLPNTTSPNPSGSDIGHMINYAHSLGFRVMMGANVTTVEQSSSLASGTYSIGRGFTDAQWEDWFDSYTTMAVRYAKLAEMYGADAFSVGSELRATTHRADDWRRVIAAVREVYHGPISYNANQEADEHTISWWDAVDFIGIDAYYTLSTSSTPTVNELVDAWDPILDRLERLSKTTSRPVVFTEVGYASFQGAAYKPWRYCTAIADLQVQADLYEALFQAIEGREWLKGVFLYVYDTNRAQGGPLDKSHTFNNKPAENVIRSYFGAPPRPTATPMPPFPLDVSVSAPVFTLYDDSLAVPGFVDPFGAPANLQYSLDAHSGSSSIKVDIPLLGFLGLDIPLDLSPYSWLEFFIKVGPRHPDAMAVSTGFWLSWSYQETFAVLRFTGAPYLAGGELRPGTWQRVRIPLADLYADGHLITAISIEDRSCQVKGPPDSPYIATSASYDSILIDDIRFIGGALSQNPLPPPAP